jgi:hypothetical protein
MPDQIVTDCRYRGTKHQAGQLAHPIITPHDDVPITAHQVAASTPHQHLPDRVARLITRRRAAVEDRNNAYTEWQKAVDGMDAAMTRSGARATDRSRARNRDNGIEL